MGGQGRRPGRRNHWRDDVSGPDRVTHRKSGSDAAKRHAASSVPGGGYPGFDEPDDDSWLLIQDIIVLLVSNGFELPYVLDLDLLSFDSLVASFNRVIMTEKIEGAWTSMIAAQASSKDMKKWTKRWEQAISAPGKVDKTDETKFLSKFGGGI